MKESNGGTCAYMCRMCSRVQDRLRKSYGYENPTWSANHGRGLFPRTIKPLHFTSTKHSLGNSVTYSLSPCGCLSSQVSAITSHSHKKRIKFCSAKVLMIQFIFAPFLSTYLHVNNTLRSVRATIIHACVFFLLRNVDVNFVWGKRILLFTNRMKLFTKN